jgi:hypothetical protein
VEFQIIGSVGVTNGIVGSCAGGETPPAVGDLIAERQPAGGD